MTYRLLGKDPETGLEVVLRDGRFGRFVHLGSFVGDARPLTASVPCGMRMDLQRALALLRRRRKPTVTDSGLSARAGLS
jgi:DNA topoisomerase-1